MSRLILVLALVGALGCKSKSAPPAHDEPAAHASHAAATTAAPASAGHESLEEAAQAFADALATHDLAKVRAEMPPRAVLATYFACDTIGARIDTSAREALAHSSVAPEGGTFIGLEDTQTRIIDGELDGCRVAEQLLVVEAVTRWKVGDGEQTSALQLVRLGSRWWTFDVPE
jgi:hypothetical protein